MFDHSANSQYQVKKLLDHSQSEFKDLFSTLSSPKIGEIDGNYKGSLMAVSGFNWLPRIVKRGMYRLLQTFINPWVGKNFDGVQGANFWFTQSGNSKFGYYDIAYDIKGEDGQLLTRLSYDVAKNIGILKPIRGEVRTLNEYLLLARMRYKTRKKEVVVLYFTLEKINY